MPSSQYMFIWYEDQVPWDEVNKALQRGMIHIREVTATTDMHNICLSKGPLTQEQVDILHRSYLNEVSA